MNIRAVLSSWEQLSTLGKLAVGAAISTTTGVVIFVADSTFQRLITPTHSSASMHVNQEPSTPTLHHLVPTVPEPQPLVPPLRPVEIALPPLEPVIPLEEAQAGQEQIESEDEEPNREIEEVRDPLPRVDEQPKVRNKPTRAPNSLRELTVALVLTIIICLLAFPFAQKFPEDDLSI